MEQFDLVVYIINTSKASKGKAESWMDYSVRWTFCSSAIAVQIKISIISLTILFPEIDCLKTIQWIHLLSCHSKHHINFNIEISFLICWQPAAFTFDWSIKRKKKKLIYTLKGCANRIEQSNQQIDCTNRRIQMIIQNYITPHLILSMAKPMW